MQKLWTGYNEDELIDAEKYLFKLSGVNETEYSSYPVYFSFTENDWKDEIKFGESSDLHTQSDNTQNHNEDHHGECVDENEYIWTYELGDNSNPSLVLIHGCGGSGMMYFKMINELKEYFHVYMIDMLGMGRSSKSEFKGETYDECERYFVSSMEKWRKAVGIEELNVIAHSLGGFVMSRYALYFPHNVKKIGFFSAFAVEETNEKHLEENEERISEMSWIDDPLHKLMHVLPIKLGVPFTYLRISGRLFGKYVLNRYLSYSSPSMSEEDKKATTNHMYHILMNKGTSEYGVNIMFPNLMLIDKAIESNLDEYKKHNIETSFYYGDNDWTDSNFKGDLVSKQLKSKGNKVFVIENAGHHLYYDNPDEGVKCILYDNNIVDEIETYIIEGTK